MALPPVRSLVGAAVVLCVGLASTSIPDSATASSRADTLTGTVVASSGDLPSIAPAADGTSTVVQVRGLGDAEIARQREGRRFRHSNAQPTGRFADQGDRITVEVPADAVGMKLAIGLFGVHAAHNGGAETPIARSDLTPGTNTVVAPNDGVIWLEDTSEASARPVTVRGGTSIPTFVRGETTNAAFRAELDAHPDAPMIEVVGDRLFGDFQPATRSAIRDADLEAVTGEWARVVAAIDRSSGLLADASGLARKAPHRIYIASADTSGGYANASHDRVMFPVSTGAAADLFRAPADDQWGLWHEIGHTYQPSAYNWDGLGEVLVNVASLAVQKDGGWANRLDDPGKREGARAFFAQPVADRAWDAISDGWVQLLMFDQLTRSFGDEFYPRLDQEMRVLTRLDEDTVVHTKASMQQLFARTAAQVTDRDLSPFFEQWGIPLDATTKAELAEHPALSRPIWENTLSTDLVVERTLDAYAVPLADIGTVSDQYVVGQRTVTTRPSLRLRGDSDGKGSARVVGDPVALTVRNADTGVGYVLANDRDVREVVTTPVHAGRGNMFAFNGIGDEQIMRFVVVATDHRLRLLPDTGSHPYFGDSEYVGIEVRTPDGATSIADGSVSGNGSSSAIVDRLDLPYEEGQIVTVRHQEARTRLLRFEDGEQQPGTAATESSYRIIEGRFTPLADAPFVAADSGTTELPGGATTAVPFTLRATRSIQVHGTGTITFTAPTGTTFADQERITADRRTSASQAWVADPRFDLGDVLIGDGGRTLTAAWNPGAGQGDAPGSERRWQVLVTADRSAAELESAMGATFTGTVDGVRTFVRGETRTELVPAEAGFAVTSPVSGSMVVAPHVDEPGFPNAKVAVTGTGDAGATVEVVRPNGKVGGSTVVGDDGNWIAQVDLGFVAYAALTVRHRAGDQVSEHVIERITIVRDGMERPFALRTPGDGSTVTSPANSAPGYPNARVRFSGTGSTSGVVSVIRANGKTAGQAVVDADGAWAFDADLPWGTQDLVVRSAYNGSTETTSVRITTERDAGNDQPFTVTSPSSNGTAHSRPGDRPGFPNAMVEFTGTGEPGAEVTVVRTHNGKVAGSVRVASDGTWELLADFNWGVWSAQVTSVEQGSAKTVNIVNVTIAR